MNELYSHRPNTHSYALCTGVEKLQLHQPGGGTFILAIFINLHSISNTITLHEEIHTFTIYHRLIESNIISKNSITK